jgi:hypothetical protein
VHGARHSSLPVRFAGDEHGRVVLRQDLDRLEDLVHHAVPADDVGERVAVGELVAEIVDFVEQAALFQHLLGGEENLLFLERLGDVVARTLLDRFDGAFDAGVASDHDDVEVGPVLLDLAGETDAIRSRDAQVDDREGKSCSPRSRSASEALPALLTRYCCEVYRSSSCRQISGSSSTMRMRVSIGFVCSRLLDVKRQEDHDHLAAIGLVAFQDLTAV